MTENGWIAVGTLDDLPDGKGHRVEVDDVTVMLVRSGDRVFAIANRCTHQGAPLVRGRVKLGESLATVTCPAHGSVFDLKTGRVLRGPATKPEPVYDVRVTGGSVALRART
jgi:nitrite reductase/ring-hydroxylating ferredoxin subunit